MKKVLSVLLCAVMALSCFALVSCDDTEEVNSINGYTPRQAYENAVVSMDGIGNYRCDLGMSFSVGYKFISVDILDIEQFCFYHYDGNNTHYKVSDEAIQELEEKSMGDILTGLDEELWYYNGVCYQKNGNVKTKFASTYNPIQSSDYELAVSEVLEENSGSVTCYKKGESYYFVVEITDPDEMKLDLDATKEVYTVYLTEKGFVEKIVVDVETMVVFSYQFVSVYEYEEAGPVTPPEDAYNYH